MPNFFFSPPNKPESIGDTTTTGGKDIRVYREEALRTLTDFMDSQLTKFDKDRRTSHHLRANEFRMHLSRIDQPLKKVNNDKGEVRNQNHAQYPNDLKRAWIHSKVPEGLRTTL